LGSPEKIFLKDFKIKSELSAHVVFNFLACLVKEKIKYQFLLGSLTTTLTNSKDCSESRVKISVSAFLLSLIHFLQCTVDSWPISEQFQDHRRLSEQLLESQAAIGKPNKPKGVCLKDFTISKLFHIYKQAETLFLGFFQEKKHKKEKKICAHS
jgi:hypothetical protein